MDARAEPGLHPVIGEAIADRTGVGNGAGEAHGALKRLIEPTRGFKTMPTAGATLKGFEIMRTIRRGRRNLVEPGVRAEAGYVGNPFDVAA